LAVVNQVHLRPDRIDADNFMTVFRQATR